MRMVLGLENGILKEIDSVKICNYFILLVMAVMLLGCAKTKSSSQTQDDSLLFVTETDEAEEDAVTIVSSSDGQICLYSRNNHTRDASWGWSIIYDVKDGNKVYTYEGLPDWEGESASVNAIYCLPHPKRHLYIFDAYTRISGAYGYQSFITYELKEHELKRVPVMVNGQGDTTSEIGFEYNFADYYFRFARTLGYDYQYKYDEETATLYYPILQAGSYYLNDRFLAYIWENGMLKPAKDTLCNPHLYEPLQNYAACLQHTKAGSVQARVDSMPDGQLRYTAWLREENVVSEPSIILYGKRVGNEYHFRNPPTYTYVVTIEDIPEIHLYHSTIPGQLGELDGIYKEE